MKKIWLMLFLSISLIASQCPQMYNRGADITTKLPIIELCYETFAIGYSPDFKIPLFVSEQLDKTKVSASLKLVRAGSFHEESKLNKNIRSTINDYKSCLSVTSGVCKHFDRGHMIPRADAPTTLSMFQTFTLANMTPQDPELNRGHWYKLEQAVRKYVLRGNSVSHVSGVIITGKEKLLNNKVTIPVFYYKAVLNNVTNEATVYVVANDSVKSPTCASDVEFKKMYGYDFKDYAMIYTVEKFEAIYDIQPFPKLQIKNKPIPNLIKFDK